MSLESFIQALPKVELNLHLEGSLNRETVDLLIEQNEIATTYKSTRHFNEWFNLVKNTDYKRIEDITREISSWLKYPEDLTRIVYELGVSLSKQNVRYAEVSVMPAAFTDAGMTFETFLEALNDGRDRVLRAWGVTINWILTIPRDRPRKGDDIARWASSAAARKGNVVGLGLTGLESAYPAEQFKKAFITVQKKDIATVSHAASTGNADAVFETMEALTVNRLTDCWNIVDRQDVIKFLADHEVPVIVTPTREMRLGRIASYEDYPLQKLIDQGVNICISSNMPAIYKTNLNEELTQIALHSGLGTDEIEKIVLNSIQASFLDADAKKALTETFKTEIVNIRETQLNS